METQEKKTTKKTESGENQSKVKKQTIAEKIQDLSERFPTDFKELSSNDLDILKSTTLRKLCSLHREHVLGKNTHGQLRAFIPGTIMEIFVKEGQDVKKGEKLLILDAMKMNNILYAPFDGKVKNIPVKTGDIVPKNYMLVEVEEKIK